MTNKQKLIDARKAIDAIDLSEYPTIQLQAAKIMVADLFQAYEEIDEPTVYHNLAYRYRFDEIMDNLACYYEIVVNIANKTSELSQSFETATLHPYIQARISAIMAEQEELDPNMSEEKKGVIFDALFAPNGEFDGLLIANETGGYRTDEAWLENYIAQSEKDGKPIKINLEFTEEMYKDIEAIEKENISNTEKEEKISSLFTQTGKYNAAIQLAYEQELKEYNQNQ